jgi:hypothetical protein
MEVLMALLDLTAGVPSFEGRTIAPPADKLGAQERLVVLLSRNDPMWSLKPRRTGSRLLSVLFGIEGPHQLADARLETLRKFAVTYRLQGPAEAEARVAEEAGFTRGQLAQVRRLIDSAYVGAPARTLGTTIRTAIFTLAALLVFSSLTAWLAPALNSGVIAFILVAVIFLTAAPFAGQRNAR